MDSNSNTKSPLTTRLGTSENVRTPATGFHQDAKPVSNVNKNPYRSRITKEEFYSSYDPMIGVQIAVMMGAFIVLVVLYLLCKVKCRGRFLSGADWKQQLFQSPLELVVAAAGKYGKTDPKTGEWVMVDLATDPQPGVQLPDANIDSQGATAEWVETNGGRSDTFVKPTKDEVWSDYLVPEYFIPKVPERKRNKKRRRHRRTDNKRDRMTNYSRLGPIPWRPPDPIDTKLPTQINNPEEHSDYLMPEYFITSQTFPERRQGSTKERPYMYGDRCSSVPCISGELHSMDIVCSRGLHDTSRSNMSIASWHAYSNLDLEKAQQTLNTDTPLKPVETSNPGSTKHSFRYDYTEPTSMRRKVAFQNGPTVTLPGKSKIYKRHMARTDGPLHINKIRMRPKYEPPLSIYTTTNMQDTTGGDIMPLSGTIV